MKKYPDDRVLRAVRASLLADSGKTDEAAAELKSMLDGKNDRETYITLAQIYEKAKNYAEMSKAIDAAEKLSDSNEDKESIAFMRGAMFEKMKNYDAAEAAFRKVLDANPKNASALNYLGYMLADRNVRLNEALELIREAVDLDPNNGAYLDSLGWVYFRMGDLEQAENNLQRAIERFSKDPDGPRSPRGRLFQARSHKGSDRTVGAVIGRMAACVAFRIRSGRDRKGSEEGRGRQGTSSQRDWRGPIETAVTSHRNTGVSSGVS